MINGKCRISATWTINQNIHVFKAIYMVGPAQLMLHKLLKPFKIITGDGYRTELIHLSL